MHLPLASAVRRTVAMTVSCVAWATLLPAVVATRQAPAPRAAGAVATPAAAALQAPDAFETRIRPLLAANCYACHGEAAMGGLRLDTREGFFKGSDAGAIVEPGKPEASSLVKVLQHAAGYPAARRVVAGAGDHRRGPGCVARQGHHR
jgi:hypothetical protein